MPAFACIEIDYDSIVGVSIVLAGRACRIYCYLASIIIAITINGTIRRCISILDNEDVATYSGSIPSGNTTKSDILSVYIQISTISYSVHRNKLSGLIKGYGGVIIAGMVLCISLNPCSIHYHVSGHFVVLTTLGTNIVRDVCFLLFIPGCEKRAGVNAGLALVRNVIDIIN